MNVYANVSLMQGATVKAVKGYMLPLSSTDRRMIDRYAQRGYRAVVSSSSLKLDGCTLPELNDVAKVLNARNVDSFSYYKLLVKANCWDDRSKRYNARKLIDTINNAFPHRVIQVPVSVITKADKTHKIRKVANFARYQVLNYVRV